MATNEEKESICFKQYVNAMSLVVPLFKDKVDKGGNPYVDHLKRVAEGVNYFYDGESTLYFFTLRTIGLLHDVVEDTEITLLDLSTSYGFDDQVVEAVDKLTRRKDESYMDFIKRCGESKEATIVKLSDLTDNMDIRRLNKITEEDCERLKKYHKAYNI